VSYVPSGRFRADKPYRQAPVPYLSWRIRMDRPRDARQYISGVQSGCVHIIPLQDPAEVASTVWNSLPKFSYAL